MWRKISKWTGLTYSVTEGLMYEVFQISLWTSYAFLKFKLICLVICKCFTFHLYALLRQASAQPETRTLSCYFLLQQSVLQHFSVCRYRASCLRNSVSTKGPLLCWSQGRVVEMWGKLKVWSSFFLNLGVCQTSNVYVVKLLGHAVMSYVCVLSLFFSGFLF
jgi:hypothetical protein